MAVATAAAAAVAAETAAAAAAVCAAEMRALECSARRSGVLIRGGLQGGAQLATINLHQPTQRYVISFTS